MKKQIACIALFIAALGTPSYAQIFVSVELGGSAIGANTAGVVSVNNWNAVDGGGFVSAASVGTMNNLNDSTGHPTGINLSFVSDGDFGGGGQLSSFSTPGDQALFGPSTGALGSFNDPGVPITLTLTNLTPTDSYSLISYMGPVFTSGGVTGAHGTVGAQSFYWTSSATLSSYIQGTATTAGAATNANYLEFTGITGSSTLTANFFPDVGKNDFEVEGFQLIDNNSAAAPEPASVWLILIGVAGIGFHLRRKHLAKA